ncbi:MAG: CDP-diacylglycerol--glycerol-3-phosphate 3-phosphatidyltransferase [Parachlamydiales bacterium]
MSIPHLLTLSRILIAPIFVLFYLYSNPLEISFLELPYILFALLVIGELTDLLDGYFARKFNQVSDLGKIFDPMADSIFHISIFFSFTQGVVDLPLLLVFVFLYRDSVIATLRTVCALKGYALAARPSGKVKAVFQALVAFTIVALMIPLSHGHFSLQTFQTIALWLVAGAALYTAASGFEYLWANRSTIGKLLTTGKKRREGKSS